MQLQELDIPVKDILQRIESMWEEVLEENITIAEIKAPPFQEAERGKHIASKFHELGYYTHIDSIGNVYAYQEEVTDWTKLQDVVITSAHLDTVFDESIYIKTNRRENILYAPGIGDDSRGLAVLLALAKIFTDVQTKFPLVFVATVGEEGKGDLRGVKHIFAESFKENCKFFLTIDGTGNQNVVTAGIGSLRYEIHFKGPGGHSYGAFGQVNPAYSLGTFMHNLAQLTTPEKPRTTYSVGVIRGGTSINSIPNHVVAELDLRSEAREQLLELDLQVKQLANDAITYENTHKKGSVSVKFINIGNRPVGSIAKNSPYIDIMKEVHEYLKINLALTASSTDANVPLSMNIPAFSVASADKAGRAHSLDEWVDAGPESMTSIQRTFLFLALVTEVY